MHIATATFQNGRLELSEPVDWPDGTLVEVIPLGKLLPRDANLPLKQWPDGFFDRLREEWGDQPIERPPQGDFEVREDW